MIDLVKEVAALIEERDKLTGHIGDAYPTVCPKCRGVAP